MTMSLLTPELWSLGLLGLQSTLVTLVAFLILELLLQVLLRSGLAEAMRQIFELLDWLIRSPMTNTEAYTKPEPGSVRDYVEWTIEEFVPWSIACLFGFFTWFCTLATLLMIL